MVVPISEVQADTNLAEIARQVRRRLIEVAALSRTAHVGSALSCVDILVSLYFDILQIDCRQWGERDIFVMSKGHAALALYTVLARRGLLEEEKLEGYFQDGGSLPAHLDRFSNRAIEVSAGSLGHGFNVALGMAHGFKLQAEKRRVVVLIGDGESQEGSIWEGAAFASRLELDNLTVILDYNNLQGYGRPEEICHFSPIAPKWQAFGWQVAETDGHDFAGLRAAFDLPTTCRPRLIIARTVKGKGVSFMEDELKWHYYQVTEERKNRALEELG